MMSEKVSAQCLVLSNNRGNLSALSTHHSALGTFFRDLRPTTCDLPAEAAP